METGIVYADVLALINFAMDFTALRITSSVLKLKPRLWRSIAGAAVGALYSFLALMAGLGGLWQIPADAAADDAVCLAVYGAKDVFKWLTAAGVFFSVGLIMGGAMTALYSRVGNYAEYFSEGGNAMLAEGAVSGWTFVLLCLASAAVTAVSGRLITRVRRRKHRTLAVVCAGRGAELSCVCDSGNFAREPISGLPVIFINEKAAAFLPDTVVRYMKSGEYGAGEHMRGLCVVPVGTVDGNSVKFAVRCERVTGEKGEGYGAVLALSKNVPDGADGIAPAVLSETRVERDRRKRRG